MMTPPQKRPSLAANGLQEHKRACTDQGKQATTEENARDGDGPRTPSSSAGTKCAAPTDLQGGEDGTQKLTIDTRAIYDANKEEIETWYDVEYSRKQGIDESTIQSGKLLRSKHRWYVKVAAWMKLKGISQSPKKKRKLNNNTSASSEVREDRPLRPHQVKYPDDLVSVPEYPLDRLEDYTAMDNKRYACSHVHLEPPKECCVFGLSKEAKRQSIKKSILRWKANVEKLIDKKQLDKRHMTWPDWTVSELRKKHQRELWDQREAKKQADVQKKMGEERQRMETQAEKADSSASPMADQEAAQHYPAIQQPATVVNPERQPSNPNPAIQQPATVTSPGRQPSTPKVSTTADIVAAPAAADSLPQQSIFLTRRGRESNTIVSAQSTFLSNLARTNPRLLRSHDALYHDAQYRENLKEHPNFARLKEWYLAYFLKQQRQPMNAEQCTLLVSGDPSYDGKMRAGGVPALDMVDKLFGEHLQAARAEKLAQQTQQQPQQSSAPVEPQAPSTGSPTLSQPLTSQTVRAESPAQTYTQDLDDLFEETVVASATASESEPVSHAPFEIMDYETLDSELDRILGTGPAHTVQPAVQATEPPSRDARTLRTEASYLTTLPQAFATGNQTVDDEVQRLLEYAYQTESTSPQFISEDEQLLRQTIEDGRLYWQRYCDLFDDGRLPSSLALAGQPVVDDFDVGELLSEEQLALFDFDDAVGVQLFAEHDERVAAAHAANLARY